MALHLHAEPHPAASDTQSARGLRRGRMAQPGVGRRTLAATDVFTLAPAQHFPE